MVSIEYTSVNYFRDMLISNQIFGRLYDYNSMSSQIQCCFGVIQRYRLHGHTSNAGIYLTMSLVIYFDGCLFNVQYLLYHFFSDLLYGLQNMTKV